MNTQLNDQFFMAEALRLACKGFYTTRKNPRVGCVIVRDSVIVGQGYHQFPGSDHAEVNALATTTDCSGSTVYVNLEPCSHSGNTPPCVEALVAAKIQRVVTAMQDPNPLVNGKGLAYLEKHDIEITTKVLENEALELNKGFVSRMTKNRPYLTVKSAISIDGKTALSNGVSKWISCDASRMDVQKLRAGNCAILTAIETIIADNPRLNVRLNNQELGIDSTFQQPKRILIDTNLRISPDAKILASDAEVLIYTCSDDDDKIAKLIQQGAEIIKTQKEKDFVDLEFVMQDLAKREINEVLVEAGHTLVGSLFDMMMVDELIIYMAPHLMGDDANGIAKITPILDMRNRIDFEILQTRVIDTDLKITLKPKYN